jgi:hypothetical protein
MASVGISDVAFELCQGTARPASLDEWFGPQQAMLIVVPKANLTTTAISAEQAAAIWGCGARGNVAPFTIATEIFQRSQTSGTQIQIAKNIGVAESAFLGVATSSSAAMLTALVNAPDPQSAIGFIAADFYASHRSALNALAFRGVGQKMAYYPDSSSIATDLRNVRDGRYMIQGPLHFFSQRLNAAGVADPNGATSPVAKLVLDWLTGAVPIDPSKPGRYVTTVATLGDVPQCAMKVQISKEGGSFSPKIPNPSCHCAFEIAKSLRSPASTGLCSPCTVADASDPCSAAGLRCQTGYCE